MHASWEALTSSIGGGVGCLSIAVEASIMGNCGEDVCVPYGGIAPLSWWFLVDVVLSLTIYVGLISSR